MGTCVSWGRMTTVGPVDSARTCKYLQDRLLLVPLSLLRRHSRGEIVATVIQCYLAILLRCLSFLVNQKHKLYHDHSGVTLTIKVPVGVHQKQNLYEN